MKTLVTFALGVLLICSECANAQSSQQLFNEAQRAYISGDVATAKQKFTTVLEIDPSNTSARNYMRMITAQEKSDTGEQMQNQLKALILPKVEFRDATFGSALEYMRQTASKQSAGKVNVSFVVQLPPEFEQTEKVTLNLANIPFTEALHYLCELGGVDYKIEKYAIVVKKKAPIETQASQPPGTATPSATP